MVVTLSSMQSMFGTDRGGRVARRLGGRRGVPGDRSIHSVPDQLAASPACTCTVFDK